jgi:hypothetical protein
MSGMKFRRTCSVCESTFFSPDRKANLCPRCSKKRAARRTVAAATVSAATRVRPQAARKRGPRAETLTPELQHRILDLYQRQYVGQQMRLRHVHGQIAHRLWVKRKLVADVIRNFLQPRNELTPELKNRAIEMYRQFVENGHRPEGGRRRAISSMLGISFRQVAKIIREWSQAEYAKSPTPQPSRQQLFEIEKAYWRELGLQRYRLTEIPAKIAEELGYVTRWQVLRWLDVLHDDECAFANVPDPPPEIQEKIIEYYKQYLASPNPPELGLHYTISQMFENLTPRQVHKVLQHYRHMKRAEYPLL